MSKKREAPPKPEELIQKLEVKLNEFKEQMEAKGGEQEKINEDMKTAVDELRNKIEENQEETGKQIEQVREENKSLIDQLRDELLEAIKQSNEQSQQVSKDQIDNISQNLELMEERHKKLIEELNLKLEQKIDKLNGKLYKNMENLSGQMESESSFNERTKEQINLLFTRVDDIHEKLYEFEVSKKNNLIFYGISGEHRETPSELMAKVTSILKQTLSLRRDIVISKAARIMTGELE